MSRRLRFGAAVGNSAMDDYTPVIPDQVARGRALHQRVVEILPRIAANASDAESIRQVPEENISLLKQVGFFRALQPAAYGGLEISLEQYCPIIVDLARACASTAWVSGLLAQHAHGLALMSKQVQDEVWSDPDALVSSSVAPLNYAVPVDGGVRLSGTFGWSSGCDHAQWAVLGFKMPVETAEGEPAWCFAMVPRSDYEIIDDWHVAGLRGTGSKTLKLVDIFVPSHRIDSVIDMSSGASKGFGIHDGGIFRSNFVVYFSLAFSAVAVGVARHMLDLYGDKLGSGLID